MVSIHCLKFPSPASWAKSVKTVAAVVNPLKSLNHQQSISNSTPHYLHRTPQCSVLLKQNSCDSHQIRNLKKPSSEQLPVNKRIFRVERAKECCGDKCLAAFPRFDLLYYKRTDKLNHEYPQTWSECSEVIKVPKAVRCVIKHPKIKKRLPQQRPQTACQQTCPTSKNTCPHTTLRQCRQARRPPKCKVITSKSVCGKENAPFPAFSECTRKMPKPRHSIECRCLLTPSVCEMWSFHHYMQRVKKIGFC